MCLNKTTILMYTTSSLFGTHAPPTAILLFHPLVRPNILALSLDDAVPLFGQNVHRLLIRRQVLSSQVSHHKLLDVPQLLEVVVRAKGRIELHEKVVVGGREIRTP